MRFLQLSLLFTICIISVNDANAQKKKGQYTVSGRVIDNETNQPIEYATISLHQRLDQSLMTGNVTGPDGKFTIEAPQGNYYIEIQFISYQSKTIADISLSAESPAKNVGEVKLAADTKTLAEVVVSGEKDQMELNLDKRVFNVSSDLTNIGRNAAEILDNVPSVNVDVDGNISLRGSGNVRILVDGKPSGLVGISSPDALRLLQGDLIERIEVITNPSARYDAEGMAGIINIILKKEKRNGVNGSFTVNAGYPENYGLSLNLNVRRKWMNLFTTYGINYRETPGSGASFQEFYPENGVYRDDTTYFTERSQSRIRSGISNSFRIGSDFFLNDKTTLTASFLYRISDEENTSAIRYRDFDRNRELLQTVDRVDNETEDDRNLEYNINLNRDFNRTGQKLTADLQYRRSTENEKSQIFETGTGESSAPLEPNDQRVDNNEYDESWLLQADYVHPFGGDGKFEAGYRSTFGRLENDYIVEELNSAGEYVAFRDFTNSFNYVENIYAVYAILGIKVDQFSYQLGLRTEVTDIDLESGTENALIKKNYINLFPSGHMTYELNKKNSLQASYSRRLNRPRSRELNPFSSFSDARNLRVGNPDLDPEFTNSYEIGYLNTTSTASYYYGAYYRRSTDVIMRVIEPQSAGQEGDVQFITRPVNLGIRDSYGLEGNVSLDLSKWWKVNMNANFYRAITEGEAFGEDLSSDTYSMSGRFNSKITIWNKINYQANLNYRAPEEMPQGRRKSYYSVDMAVNKEIFNGKGTITASVSDLFNTRKWRSETFGKTFATMSEFQWRARQFMLTLNYRLNQKSKQREDKSGGGDYDGGDGERF